MTFSKSPEIRWNIFVRELEDVLQAHGLPISKLDDKGIAHSQKVARLQHSLEAPISFPTLNPEELERLETNVPLTPDERARLRAALAAAAVERALMDRMDPPTALMAADDVFHVLLARVQREPDSPLAGVRAGAGFGAAEEESGPLAAALDSIDRATLALHSARDASGRAKEVNTAAAEREFARALELLERMGQPADKTEAASRRQAHDEALAGRAEVAALTVPAGAHAKGDGGGE
ncbi:MAG TPA: hypothetical protein VF116_03060 [Ktedonobacterales bacterium]